ncbi:MAG: phage holin family protein [Thermoleophilia bacterium]|nr:phage holin family protein [Thermoleophilia bacterium]
MSSTRRRDTPLLHLHTYIRALISVAISTGTLYFASAILPGLDIEDPLRAIVAAIAISVANALLWPLLIRFALPVAVLTLGLAGFAINAALVWAIVNLIEGIDVTSFWTAMIVAFLLTLTNTIVTSLFGIDDDDFYYRNVIRRQARKHADASLSEAVPGILFLEIDGLAEPVMRRAIRDGNVPELARWLRSGSHRLEGWECDWSSQTSASQSGILHGSNEDIPAFRWFEKETGTFVVSNHPGGAAEIERRHSDGRGLLAGGGASRGNLVTGDAEHTSFTISALHARPTRGKDYYAYFANPYTVFRTFILSMLDIGRELYAAAQQIRRDVVPRVHRGLRYSLLRAVTVVILRDIAVQTVIADAYAGRPVVYSTFVGYDEVAHHSGIERYDALDVLRGIDQAFGRITHAAETADRPYHVVVLSDHGQSQGATFLSKYDITLEGLVHGACEAAVMENPFGSDEAWGQLSAAVSELVIRKGSVLERITQGHESGDAIVLGPGHELASSEGAESVRELIKVLASGSLGLIYLDAEPGRRTLEQINATFPHLIPRLVKHKGIGFILVLSEQDGPLAIGAHGVHHLETGRIEGIDPLLPFGPNAARHVLRTSGFAHVADLMINASFDEQTCEIGAFEELVGSHGGLGGEQMHPFVLFPSEFPWPEEPVVSAEHLHRVLVGWLHDLGHDIARVKHLERLQEEAATS